MESVLVILDDVAPGASAVGADWYSAVAASLNDDPQAWISEVARIGELSDQRAWSLLSWIEKAATQVVCTKSAEALITSAFAMAIVLHSALDRRDCAIVASLLRRASVLADLNFVTLVAEGCGRAGAPDGEAARLLLTAPADLPSTHRESIIGSTFSFTRAEPGFDVGDLERWLEGEVS